MTQADRQKLQDLLGKLTTAFWRNDGALVCPAYRDGETVYVQSWRPVAEAASTDYARFIAAANPAAVLALLDEMEAANANHENAVAHLRSVCAERDRLNALLIEREAVRIGQSLQRHDDQKQMDELVALGIQQDKDEIARLKAEVAALRDALADKVVDSTKLRSLVPEDGGFTIGVEGGAAGLMAHAFGEQLYTSEAINYLQMTFTSNAYPDLGQIVVTLQRCTGKTPHELRIDAEQERDQLKAENSELRRDSGRYRWLRESKNTAGPSMVSVYDTGELDSAIDRMIAKEQP